MPLALCMLLFGLAPMAAPSPVPATSVRLGVEDPKIEYERRLELAQGDIKKLWMLHNFCVSNGLKREDRKVLRAILKLDDEHVEAHEGLGHIFFDNRWFTSKKKYNVYKAEFEEQQALAKGWVRYEGTWTDPADVEKLKAGLVKDEDGTWMTAQQLKYKQEGWVQFDLDWIPPAEQENIKQGLFKCGDKWLSESDANQYHKLPPHFWKIPSEQGRFIIYTTMDREQALEALSLAEAAVPDMVRIFGRTPDHPVVFAVLRSISQYGRFAAGDDEYGTKPTEMRGFSSLHGAYFADIWLGENRTHMGAGVAYWDHSAPSGDEFGKLFVRNAAGHSFVEGLDPSPVALAKLKKTNRFSLKSFLAEKKLPLWLRYGTAAYIERYRLVNEPDTDPISLRRWSVSSAEKRGGLDSVSTILRMDLSAQRPGESEKLISEAGLLLAYILDGDNVDVKAKHAAFRIAFSTGKPFEDELTALEDALRSSAVDVRRFAEL